MKLILSAAVALVLCGCATESAWFAQAKQLNAQGQCQAARNVVNANATDLGGRASMTGAIWADCDKNMPEAIRWFTLAARYGDGYAQQTLASLRQPVPAADLAQRQQSGSALESLARGYNSTPSRGAPQMDVGSPSVNCTARQTSMGKGMNQTYDVNCR